MERAHLKLIVRAEPLSPTAPADQPEVAPPSHAFVTSLLRRDAAALTRLYTEHRGPLLMLARRMLGDELEAEDLVHDVFVTVPKALRSYSGENALGSFLCGILVNLSRRRLRSLGRRRRALRRLLDRVGGTAAASSNAHHMERRELALRLTMALDQLPFAQRVAVVLCLIEERSADEAGAILGVPEATVRTRLFYGRKRLQVLLGEHE